LFPPFSLHFVKNSRGGVLQAFGTFLDLGDLTMSLVGATKKKRDFDPKKFLATIGEGRRIVPAAKKQTIYAQGAPCDAVFYIREGR
jgi:hypothetical protein